MTDPDMTQDSGRLHLLERLADLYGRQIRSIEHSRTLNHQRGEAQAVAYLDAQLAVLHGLARVTAEAQRRMVPPAEWVAAMTESARHEAGTARKAPR